MNKVTPENIRYLKHGEIFVFGSNLQGIHGRGAAKQAMAFGAMKGRGVGLSGSSYAIPTREYHGLSRFTTMSLAEIKKYVDGFIDFALLNDTYKFFVTAIGTGNAGYSDEQMAPLFKEAMDAKNIYLPAQWIKINLVS